MYEVKVHKALEINGMLHPINKKDKHPKFKKDKISEVLNKGSGDYVSSGIFKLLFNEMRKH